jgi:ATP-dependent Clp protease ATP-binding subunit ClpA
MFERFSDPARRVVVLAQEESRMLNHNYIGTEHFLLGLVHEGHGVAAQVLEASGISLESVRDSVMRIIGLGQTPPTGHIPFTPRAKKVLDLSLREALQLGQNYIGTEHILLGLIREGEGVAAQVLVQLGLDLISARQKVMELLHGSRSARRTVGSTESFTLHEATVEVGTERVLPITLPAAMPLCRGCHVSLEGFLKYRVLDAQEDDGDGIRKVLFLFCSNCGRAIDDWMVPE